MEAPLNQKPFKGVIRDWWRDGGVVSGICVWHADAVPISAHAVLHEEIVAGEAMHTSWVVNILDFDTFSILQTRRSYYVLIEPRKA